MSIPTRTTWISAIVIVAGVAVLLGVGYQLGRDPDPGERAWTTDTKLGAADPGRSHSFRPASRAGLGPSRRDVDPANTLVEEWSLHGPPTDDTLRAVEQAKDLTAFVLDGDPGALDLALSLADPALNGEIYAHCGPVYAPKHGACHLSVVTSFAPGPDGDLVVDYAKAEVHEGSPDECKNYAACFAREAIGRAHPSQLDALPVATRQTFTAGPWDQRFELSKDQLEACIALYAEQVEEIELMGDSPPDDMPDFEFVAGLMRMQLGYCEHALRQLEAGR